MNLSIKDILHTYAATLTKTWAHDRSKTVGASEIGLCARRTWFDKHDAPRDSGYVDNWGARLRGTQIEDHFWVPALEEQLPYGMRLLFAGSRQQTLVDGYLSATTDGLIVDTDTGECVNLDCKSIDPRADLRKEKSAHTFQVQVQMGLIRKLTEYQPNESIVSYIDASAYDKITEFRVTFDQRVFAGAQSRAQQIMTAADALDLAPEGKMAGGDECAYCPWASHCAAVTVAGVPREDRALTDNLAGVLRDMRNAERQLAETSGYWSAEHKRIVEEIKAFLREHNIRRYNGDDWSVSYSTVSGRETLDVAAIENSGIDLSAFKKTGNPSERLTVK